MGTGRGIVSGSITPDAYVVSKRGLQIIDINVSEQEKMIVRKGESGNEWVSVSITKQNEQKLSGAKIIELSKILFTIEKHYGFPCDIEWAFEKGKFYITQSRPITTLG